LEENVFCPAVHAETDEGPALVQASVAGHETVTILLHALRTMAPETEAFDATLHARIYHAEHHGEEEESAMFPLAAQALLEDRDDLQDEKQERKAELQGS
jgi:hypothetical protein